MTDVALYFPHIWVRDASWLKAALLYWPRIAHSASRGRSRLPGLVRQSRRLLMSFGDSSLLCCC